MLITVIEIISYSSIKAISNQSASNYEKAVITGYKNEISQETNLVISVIQEKYNSYKSGEKTEEEAKEEAKELVRNMRYGEKGSGYFWIDDIDYNLVMHPILTEQEGTNRKNLEDKDGVKIVQEIVKTAKSKDGCGYNEFYFTKDDGVTVAPKIAYSQIFEPWGWIVSTGNYTDTLDKDIALVKADVARQGNKIVIFTSILGIVMIAIVVFISIKIGNNICNPLKEIQNMSDRMKEGNLTVEAKVMTNDELGSTATSLNIAQKQVGVLVSGIEETTNTLKDAVEHCVNNFDDMKKSISNVTQAVEEIAKNSTSQAQETSSADERIINMADEIKDTYSIVESLGKESKVMEDCSDKSMIALKKLIDVNKTTRTNIASMKSQTKSTNSSVEKINNSATLISEISEQTNLLALNASIEAARAGEAGKGFAVVAEEIGKLAAQSASTAQEINNIIEELNDNSVKSVNMMNEMNNNYNDEITTLDNTKDMFDSLKESLNVCMKHIDQVVERIKHMDNEREDLTNNIDKLSSLAMDNASSTEETSATAMDLDNIVGHSEETMRELSEKVKSLSDSIGIFKI